MNEREVERLNKKLLPIFEKAKVKYKDKCPILTFIIQPQGSHEFIGMKDDKGDFEGISKKYGFFDKWYKGTEKLTLNIKFDKKIQGMKDLKDFLRNIEDN